MPAFSRTRVDAAFGGIRDGDDLVEATVVEGSGQEHIGRFRSRRS